MRMTPVAERYRIIQFGVCLWHKTGPTCWEARPYNFYTFPSSGAINMEGGAVAFNVQHNMDWNKWIRSGIPYVTAADEARLRRAAFPNEASVAAGTGTTTGREAAAGTAKAWERRPVTLTRDSDIATMSEAQAAVSAWLKSADDPSTGDGSGGSNELLLPRGNGFIRKAYYQWLESEHPDLIAESRPVPGGNHYDKDFYVLRLTEAEKQARAEKEREERERALAAQVGVRRVYTAMAASQKPLVGHNCMFDTLFMLAHFESNPLPSRFTDLQALMRARFPVVYDTKVLASHEHYYYAKEEDGGEAGGADAAAAPQKRTARFENTSLGCVHQTLEKELAGGVEISLAPGFSERYTDSANYHEAAFDAYVTGNAFVRMTADVSWSTLEPKLRNRFNFMRGIWQWRFDGECECVYKDDEPAYHMAGSAIGDMNTSDIARFVVNLCAKGGARTEFTEEAAEVEGGGVAVAAAAAGEESDSSSSPPVLTMQDVKIRWGGDQDVIFSLTPLWAQVTARGVATYTAEPDCKLTIQSLSAWVARRNAMILADLDERDDGAVCAPPAKRARSTDDSHRSRTTVV